MEIKTSNTYILTFEDLKRQFPDIDGDLVEISIDEKKNSIVVDTMSVYYEDSGVVINKEVVSSFKDVYRIRDKKTNAMAEGSTEQEARDKLVETLKQGKSGEDGKKPGKQASER